MLEIIITVILAIISGEFLGYWLHVLLHSNKIEFLSKAHMIHHLVVYGPKQEFTSDKYKTSLIDNRPGIAGVGLEWIIPVILIVSGMTLILWALNIPLHLAVIFVMATGIWELIMFNYMHDALHLRHFWMINNKLLSKWFLQTRQKHLIHHLEIDNTGRMNTNYGICFFFFDKLFRTFEGKLNKFNEFGYEKAKTRYSYIYEKLK